MLLLLQVHNDVADRDDLTCSQVSDLHFRWPLELRVLELDFLQLGVLAVESGVSALRGRQPR